jgi:protein subunit release factor A
MKSKILLYILILSLAFNIGFIVNYILISISPNQDIVIPAQTRRHLREHRINQNEEILELRTENIHLRMEFFNELAQFDVNVFYLQELINELAVSQRLLDNAAFNNFIDMRFEMTDEEAHEFFGALHDMYERRANRQERHNNE